MGFELAALFAGLIVGAAVAAVYDRQRQRRLRTCLAALRSAADAKIATIRSNAKALAAQRGHTLSREALERDERLRQTLEQIAATLASREAVLRELETHAHTREERLQARMDNTSAMAANARTLKKTRHTIIANRLTRLSERAGVSADTARNERLQAAVAAGTHWVKNLAALRDDGRNLSAEAARVLDTVCQRYDGVGHLERLSSTFELAPAIATALADADSEMSRALRSLLGVTWTVSDGGISIRADDSAEREAARRLFKRQWQTVTAMQSLVMSIKEDIQREIISAGHEAFAVLGLPASADEVVALVGRLKFRLSFSQNQWKHSVEVARLAAMLAAELGLDRVRARRGGLLHDMGKAMTHDHEGAHAVLGAAVARRNGEDEIVANAIGAHHGDEPMSSPVAFLVTGADALSGARPGARRESVTTYLTRLRNIHEIASRGPFVQHVDVMHAGREVRVTVSSEAQDDALHPLAQRIARALEDEIAFPGQIRITVTRESRVSAIAR